METMPETTSDTDTANDANSIAAVIADWQSKLLQMDRRNPLLYFDPERRTTIRIASHTPDAIHHRLGSTTRRLKFDYIHPQPRGGNRFMRPEERDAAEHIARGDISADDVTAHELQRRLEILRKRAKEQREEQGLSVLSLALGLLSWVDANGNQADAPLLLYQVDLDRNSPREPFTLGEEDEDIHHNHTLAVKLREFGIELPEYDADAPSEYFAAVRRQLVDSRLGAPRPGWSVKEDVYLAAFAYSKLAMWNDLERIRVHGVRHPIARALAGDAPDIRGLPSPMPLDDLDRQVAGGLDDALDIRDSSLPLPADYSQLIAVAGVKYGRNLIVHGPPGTGKSQTIANMIAAAIADDKKVLFVSEKSAALDVVKRRLDDIGLGVFCLDLHSERGRKSNVYEQLRQSIDDPRLIDASQFDYAELEALRHKLNATVRALHVRREPLGDTAFRMHARLAASQRAPSAAFEVANVEELSAARFASILDSARRIAQYPRPFRELATSHWRALRQDEPSLGLADAIRADMAALDDAAQALTSAAANVANAIGLEPPRAWLETPSMRDAALHLSRAPRLGVPPRWIEAGAVAELRPLSERQSETQRELRALSDELRARFALDDGERAPAWDCEDLLERIRLDASERNLLAWLLGGDYSSRLVERELAAFDCLERLRGSLYEALSAAAALAKTLGLDAPDSLSEIQRQIELADAIARTAPIPQSWLAPRATEALSTDVADARQTAEALDAAEAKLFADYDEEIVGAVDRRMLNRYRVDHRSRFKRIFSRAYREDRDLLRSLRREPGGESYEGDMAATALAVEVSRLRRNWADLEGEIRSELGAHFLGRRTNWDELAGRLARADELIAGWRGSRPTLETLLADSNSPVELRELIDPATEASDSLRALLREAAPLELGEILNGNISLSHVIDALERAAPTLRRLRDCVTTPTQAAIAPLGNLDTLAELLRAANRVQRIERDSERSANALAAKFGARFAGLDTDWGDVDAALDWAERMKNMWEKLGGAHPSPALREHCANPRVSQYYERLADSATLRQARDEFECVRDSLSARYRWDGTPLGDWEAARFEDIIGWTNRLSADAAFAYDWLGFLSLARELEDALGADAIASIRAATDDAREVPAIVERRVVSMWLDWLYRQEPLLADFTADSQTALRERFELLDKQMQSAARNEIRQKVFARYPTSASRDASAGQLGTLKRELSKKRRQLPVRSLFERIPHLLKTIKPCFLVSPLAVSQYLPIAANGSDEPQFDLVIFDEASQVFPEDAIPAILRGRQLVLAGDSKQLPPTSFFRASIDDDDFDDDDPDAPTDYLSDVESILDAAGGKIGSVFAEAHLNVHYRSRDERLIRFSNHWFYDNRLLTFPSPREKGGWNGVVDIYVEDALFEGGVNRREAEKVADLVFEHMRERPSDESLGVVAMSRNQADLIERIIDERRVTERDVDARFAEGGAEPFFVKNLERAQGDERDHMIVGIGYAPNKNGRVSNNFGAINREGGGRRMNVAVTRSKMRMTVVHSLKPADIRSNSDGARLLRRFLEFAENPEAAFSEDAVVDTGAEADSPFEEAVESELKRRGYRVVRQVGVSGYRVDLAILSEDGSGIDLGIECDGATYHSAPAARDRDWLRQQALEAKGWNIHRVWSTSWIRNPDAELDAIEDALGRARSAR